MQHRLAQLGKPQHMSERSASGVFAPGEINDAPRATAHAIPRLTLLYAPKRQIPPTGNGRGRAVRVYPLQSQARLRRCEPSRAVPCGCVHVVLSRRLEVFLVDVSRTSNKTKCILVIPRINLIEWQCLSNYRLDSTDLAGLLIQ